MQFMKQSIIILTIFTFAAETLTAQDLHFSQFFNNPLLTNPANTGFIPDADYRLGASYRNQYSSILANPYNTFSIYGDAQFFATELQWLVGIRWCYTEGCRRCGSLTSTKAYAYYSLSPDVGSE